MARRVSRIWDSMAWLKGAALRSARREGESARQTRRRLRCEAYDDAVAGENEGIVSDHENRRAFWLGRYRRGRLRETKEGRDPAGWEGWVFAQLIGWSAFILIAVGTAVGAVASVLPLVIGGAIVGVIVMRLLNRRSRALRALQQMECPDCRYPLLGVPMAFAEAPDARIGPTTCPECGTPWPLAPPPATGEVRHGPRVIVADAS